MACVTDESVVLACVPSAIPADRRVQHFALARELLTQQAVERVDMAEGYGFRFAADKLVELVQFMDNERKCCPFMSFELLIAPESGPIWLRMTGPAGTRQVLQQAELSLVGSCGCRQ